MPNKHQVHNLIILDESGSMDTIKTQTIAGFNEIVQTIKGVESQYPEQEHFISLVTFNGLGRKTHLWKAPVKDLRQLDGSNYKPDASTPLYDAMGISMGKLSTELTGLSDCNVLVTILTDGEENASVEYSSELIRKMVENLEKQNWTFTYIGTDHDVTKIAISLSITNVMKFEKNDAAMKAMFQKEGNARHLYSKKIRENENTSRDFYPEEN